LGASYAAYFALQGGKAKSMAGSGGDRRKWREADSGNTHWMKYHEEATGGRRTERDGTKSKREMSAIRRRKMTKMTAKRQNKCDCLREKQTKKARKGKKAEILFQGLCIFLRSSLLCVV